MDVIKGTVSLQTPLPFEIKKEPGLEEDLFSELHIKIDTQSSPESSTAQKCGTETEKEQSSEYKIRLLDIEKQLQTTSVKPNVPRLTSNR